MKILLATSPSPEGADHFYSNTPSYLYMGSILQGQDELGLPKVAEVKLEDTNIRKEGEYEGLKRDGIFSEDSMEDIIEDYDPDILGTTVYEFNYKDVKNLFDSAKKVKNDLITAVGGPFATAAPYYASKVTNSDIVFRGEADFTFREAVKRLSEGEDLEDLVGINGLVAKKDDKILYGDKSKIIPTVDQETLENIEFDREIMMETQRELKYLTYSVALTRTCPYGRCSFCYHSSSDSEHRNLLTEEKEDDVMELLTDIDTLPYVKKLFFGDPVLGGGKKGAKKLLYNIGEHLDFEDGLRGEFSVKMLLDNGKFGEREVDYEMVELMEESSCKAELGVERLSEGGLKEFDKFRYTPEEAMRVIKALGDNGVVVGVNLMQVGPETSPENLIEHLENVIKIQDDLKEHENINFNHINGLNPYLGTKEYQKIVKKMSNHKEYSSLVTSFLANEDIIELPDDDLPYLFKAMVPFDDAVGKSYWESEVAKKSIEISEDFDLDEELGPTVFLIESLKDYLGDRELVDRLESIEPQNKEHKELQEFMKKFRHEALKAGLKDLLPDYEKHF